MSKMTAHVLSDGGFSIGTPRTCDCAGTDVDVAATGGFIARPNAAMIAQRLPGCKGSFTPIPEGRGPLVPTR